MKKFNKLLLSSSALVGTALLANAASAGTLMMKDDLTVNMTGFVAFQAGIYDTESRVMATRRKDGNKSRYDNNHHDFRTKMELEFNGRNVADSGLEYGFEMRFQNKGKRNECGSTNCNSDSNLALKELKVWMEGDWGHLDFGDDHGPAQKMDYRAPTIGMGQIDGDHEAFLGPLGSSVIGLEALNSKRSTKIAYYTPRWNYFSDVEGNGVQFGASYAPEFNSKFRNVETRRHASKTQASDHSKLNLDCNYKQFVEFGANMVHDFDALQVRIFGVYDFANAKKRINGNKMHDINSWSVGGQLAMAGFTLGGAYVDASDSGQMKKTLVAGMPGTYTKVNNSDKNAWNLGLTYENGPWGVGVSYLHEDLGNNNNIIIPAGTSTLLGGEYDIVSAGVNYVVAPGLSVAADVSWFERDFKKGVVPSNGTELVKGNDNDGWIAILQTRIDF